MIVVHTSNNIINLFKGHTPADKWKKGDEKFSQDMQLITENLNSISKDLNDELKVYEHLYSQYRGNTSDLVVNYMFKCKETCSHDRLCHDKPLHLNN